ncbi:hypothetical protein [Bifidobacterium samirii]|uniref:Uncharacterized protein n=1 Tax=Bifidobacterium samirii TaxID=2306974 RepID=A0A430FHJ0_9BIFI|nr:hypothetical protein [Bifidobacterium samirii]RSX52261.1 hypothetical protein D2E24_1798 [Bifidobacterium samirii]
MTQTTDERCNPDEGAAAIAALAGDTAVRDAAHAGARLIALWPLTDAKQLDNDAKYAENLQVRTTRMIARVTTGLDVTMPDAEFVYEGADEIPGRPQEVVDALLAANDAYDTMADYGDALAGGDMDGGAADAGADGADDVAADGTDGAAHDVTADGTDAIVAAGYDALCDAADAMAAGWTDAVADAVHAALAAAVPAAFAVAADGVAGDADDASDDASDDSDGAETEDSEETAETATPAALARRFAAALDVCDALLTAVERAAGDDAEAIAAAGLPVLLFVNELRETLGVPRICLNEDDYRALLAARAAAQADAGDADGSDAAPAAAATLAATARVIAPLAAAEWARHYEDVMWDPEEAKKRAKEEDERKNKEALAAKFAHVKDDPTKPAVEL